MIDRQNLSTRFTDLCPIQFGSSVNHGPLELKIDALEMSEFWLLGDMICDGTANVSPLVYNLFCTTR